MSSYRVSSLDDQVEVACYKLGTAVSPTVTTQLYTCPPPPPYEKVTKNPSSMLTRLWSGYVWKKQNDSDKDNDNAVSVFDKKLVEQALTLINIATEMDQSGNHKMAVDLYLMGLDRILYAIPVQTGSALRKALEWRLYEFTTVRGLEISSPPKQPTNYSALLSNLIVNSLVFGAVTLKKSPLPDAVAAAISMTKSGLRAVDDTYQIRKRASNGIAALIELEQQSQIHMFFVELFKFAMDALAKAEAAYKETPGYKERSRQNEAEGEILLCRCKSDNSSSILAI